MVIDDLQFRLVVPHHDRTSRTYCDNVARYLEGAHPEDIFAGLKISSHTQTKLPTKLPTGTHTPLTRKAGAILWKRKLGQGAFGVVNYAWDVTTREEYAVKEPLRRFRGDSTTPFQRGQVAIQVLEGLAYLHGELLLAHRDIKPENILVQSWQNDRIHLKLADFGLSKQSDDLRTICGTRKYMAPEIFCAFKARSERPEDVVKYGLQVDIWSLAVVLARLECLHLPVYTEDFDYGGNKWAKEIIILVETVQEFDPVDLLTFALENMLVLDPEQRQSAGTCLALALERFGRASSDASAPPSSEVATTFSSGSAASTIRPAAREASSAARSRHISGPLPMGSGTLMAGLVEGSALLDNLMGMAPTGSTQDTVTHHSTHAGLLYANVLHLASAVRDEDSRKRPGEESSKDGSKRSKVYHPV